MNNELNNLLNFMYQHLSIAQTEVNINHYSGGYKFIKVTVRTDINPKILDDNIIESIQNTINEFKNPITMYILNFENFNKSNVKVISNNIKLDKNQIENSFCLNAYMKYDSENKIVTKRVINECISRLYTDDERIEIRKTLDCIEKEYGIVDFFKINPTENISKLYYYIDLFFHNKEILNKIYEIAEGSYVKDIRYYLSVGNEMNYFVIDIDGYNFKRNYNHIFQLDSFNLPIKITVRDRSKTQFEEIDRFFSNCNQSLFNIKYAFDDYFSEYYDKMNSEYYFDIFQIRLDKGLINRYLVRGEFIYFIGKHGNIILAVKKDTIIDINKFMDGINLIITKANFDKSIFNTNINK